jgi:hypothetical protein
VRDLELTEPLLGLAFTHARNFSTRAIEELNQSGVRAHIRQGEARDERLQVR